MPFLPFYRRKLLMKAFFSSQFSYCPLVWMFHSRGINTTINNLHFRALRMIYQDQTSSFDEILRKDGSVTIHHRNLQILVTEMFKVTKGISPAFMEQVFPRNFTITTECVSANTRPQSAFYNSDNPKKVNSGIETLRCLGPKIWDMVPSKLKNIEMLSLFKTKIKDWIPANCPCRLCKTYIPQLGYL